MSVSRLFTCGVQVIWVATCGMCHLYQCTASANLQVTGVLVHHALQTGTHWRMLPGLITQSVTCGDTRCRCWLSAALLHSTSLPAWRLVLSRNATHLNTAGA